MSPRTKKRTFMRTLRDIDDVVHLATGKRLKDIGKRIIDIWGEDLVKKAAGMVSEPEEGNYELIIAYAVLGVNQDAPDIVVKGAYRSLAREYHPDTGAAPDKAKFQSATESYNKIMAARENTKKENGS